MKLSPKYKITWYTGVAIVIANMIGTGVFTSLGFQIPEIQNTYTIIFLWVLGGIFALAGAFSYAEVGTFINESGGEYVFLSKIIHPFVGYLSGWISISVGFAAPVALASIAISEYVPINGFKITYLSIAIILIISLVHSFNLKISALFQNISTSIKIIFIILFVVSGFLITSTGENAISFTTSFSQEIWSAAFAISLIYVTYSYSGWNAAAYIVEEFKSPIKDLPKALITGTIVVTILYTLLQIVFLRHAPYDELVNQIEVGSIAANHMFTPRIAGLFSGMISLLLISSISAMIWVGPRVVAKMAEDYRIWSFLKLSPSGIPVKAIWFQAIVSLVLILSGTFEQILIYCGILLNLSSALVVVAVFVIRRHSFHQLSYRSPGYPVWQIIFLLLSVWMIIFAITNKPLETLIGFINILLGIGTYLINHKIETHVA